MNSPLRTPTKRLAARVSLDDGGQLVGDLHLHPNAKAPGGFESVVSLIENDDAFFPLCEEGGAVALVGKRRTISLCYETKDVASPERDTGAAPAELEMVLSDGRTLRGTVIRELPSAYPRTLEFLNGPGVFVRIEVEDHTHLVNREHIRIVRPLD